MACTLELQRRAPRPFWAPRNEDNMRTGKLRSHVTVLPGDEIMVPTWVLRLTRLEVRLPLHPPLCACSHFLPERHFVYRDMA